MSVHEAIAWAIEVSKGEPMPARMLLIVGLAARCGDRESGFVVWPSHRQIAEDCDMSRASVKRWLGHLEDKQFIEKFSAKRDDGGTTSNRYRLPVKAIFFHPTKGAIDRGAGVRVSQGGGVTVNHGAGQSGEPAPGSSGEPCNEQPFEHQLEDSTGAAVDEELDLGLPPIPPKDPSPSEVAAFIQPEWLARAHATPLRGGRLSEDGAEKARDLGKKFAAGEQSAIDVWREIFAAIDRSDWLQGKVPGRGDRPPFKLSMPWLLEKRNFEKVLEGRYDGQSSGERPRGTTSEATGRVLQRIRTGRGRSPGRGNPGRALAGRS